MALQWEEAELKGPGNYDFFHEVELARDGGLSEVRELWSWSRWLSASMACLLIVSNLATLGINDLTHIREAWDVWLQEPSLSAFAKDMVMGLVWLFGLGGGGATHKITGVAMFSMIEVLLSVALLCRAVCAAWMSRFARGEERKTWQRVAFFYWRLVPELGSISGMRLLHFMSPGVLSADCAKLVYYSRSMWSRSKLLLLRKWLKFLCTRIGCLFVGLGCFIVKLQPAQRYVPNDTVHVALGLWGLLNLIMFINQILGIVQLQLYVRSRIKLFIFGGVDSVMQPHERASHLVWHAMLARAIFEEYPWHRAAALMLTFNVQDFQRLVLNKRVLHNGASGASGHLPRRSSWPEVAKAFGRRCRFGVGP